MKFKKTIISLLIMVTLLLNGCNKTDTNNNTQTSSDTQTTTETVSTSDNTAQSISNLEGIKVHEVNIELKDEDWQDILDNAIDEEFHTATITYDGTKLEDIAFRTKGNSSLFSIVNSDSERYGFKIKTDKYVANQYLNGTNEFVLNAAFSDPSYLREYITYNASKYLGLTTPETEFVQLKINDKDYGLYLYVESYDHTFVENNTNSNDTQLYKAESTNCTLTKKDGTSGFELKYGDDENLEKIQELIDTLDASDADNMEKLESILDVSSVLKYAALSYTFGSYDSYLGDKAHNYYLIYTNGKFQMLGWDYNMALGGYSSDNGSSLNLDTDSLYLNTTAEKRPLVSKLLEVSKYKTEFLGYVDDLKTWLADYDSALNTMGNDISQYVENDSTAFYTIDQFWENIKGTDLALSDVPEIKENMKNGPDEEFMKNNNEMPQQPNQDNNEMPQQPNQGDKQMMKDFKNKDVISINDYIRLKLEK